MRCAGDLLLFCTLIRYTGNEKRKKVMQHIKQSIMEFLHVMSGIISKMAMVKKTAAGICILMIVVICFESCTTPKKQEPLTIDGISWLRPEGTKIVNSRGETVILKGLFLPNNTWGNWIWPISDRLAKEGKDYLIKPVEQDPWVLTDRDFEIFAGLHLNCVGNNTGITRREVLKPTRESSESHTSGRLFPWTHQLQTWRMISTCSIHGILLRGMPQPMIQQRLKRSLKNLLTLRIRI
jgi:hypothetical protein